MTRAVSALTFCLTLLGAPTVRAGGSAGSVDALTFPKMTLHSCAAQRATCDDGVPFYLHRPDLECTVCGEPPEPAPELTKAKQQLCAVLKLMLFVPLPASCQGEPSEPASFNSTAHL